MESALIATTVASLLLAASLVTMAARHVRERRARAAALKSLAFPGDAAGVPDAGLTGLWSAERPGLRSTERPGLRSAERTGLRSVEPSGLRSVERFGSWSAGKTADPATPADVDSMRSTPVATALPMFAAVDEPPPPSRRWVSLAGVAAVVIVALSMVALLHDPVAAPGDPAAPRAAAGPAVPRAAPPAPIALVALRHEIDRTGTLTVTGVVRNPASNTPLAGVTTVVTAFDRQGARIATREAPIDLRALAPDAASGFEATLAGARGVARFDVAFRRGDGSTIPHVDRRGGQ